MPLDLSHPRRILPFDPRTDSITPTPAAEPSSSLGKHVGRGRRALQLKLSQDVMSQLFQLAKEHGVTAGGKVQLDIRPGKQPALIVNGTSHPLELTPEPPHSEILRLSPASRDLQPIATLSHKATIKADSVAERMAKASQNLRVSREKEEKEKESKKAVLLESASSASRSPSSSSLSRTKATATKTAALSPPAKPASPLPPSRSQVKHPSRLVATGPRPPSTTSSFRIGKGSIPLSIAQSQAHLGQKHHPSSASSSSISSASSNSTPVASPQPSISQIPPNPPRLQPQAQPTRQFSTSSTSSSNASAESSKPLSSASVSNSSTLGTSPESLVAPLKTSDPARLPTGATTAVETKKTGAGGGGIMKGKGSLRKEAKSNNKASRSLKSANSTQSSGNGDKVSKRKGKEKEQERQVSDQEDGVSNEDIDAEGEVDEEMPSVSRGDDRITHDDGDEEAEADAEDRAISAKKKRKDLNGLAVESRNDPPERAKAKEKRSTIPIKTVVKKVVSTASEGEGRKSSTSTKSSERRVREPSGKDRERSGGRLYEQGAGEKEKTKKRKKQETSRWYSSDSDDAAETVGELSQSRSASNAHRSTSSTIEHSRTASPPPPAHSRSVTVDASSLPATRSRFFELYAPYAVLHSRLSAIRSALELGQPIRESPKQLRTLVEDCGKQRSILEGLKQAIGSSQVKLPDQR